MKGACLSAFVLLLMITSTGCSVQKAVAEGKQTKEITVFAAASLTESFQELAADFEKQEGNKVKIAFNFAGSQTLKTALENGVKADIFASASLNYMDDLKKEGFVKDYHVFLKNRLMLIKNRSSSYHIKTLNDLSAEGLRIAVGDKSVPVGMYWEKAFDRAYKDGIISGEEKTKIEKNIKTRELNVKDVVSKVIINGVDAGVVYKTDVTKENINKLEEINVPALERFDADYPIAILKESEGNNEVRKFYEYVLSDKVKEIFKNYNFITQ